MMYTKGNQIAELTFDNLQIVKIAKTDSLEILSISLEKEATFPEHSSPREAQLIVLEGEILFHINNTTYQLKTHQNFNFPKATPHTVKAIENSKFLIIR
ncbi:cupin domain-containing protein [uncultured Eudoraea sp.]|uniref:cupin domain-containing protein n=1 Tax=uncultured Eudoraea sp. TaxID=1035614 RepID=UPI0026127B39|nr:cupin domain-containing protein [uncultured Eudoraea sp.]